MKVWVVYLEREFNDCSEPLAAFSSPEKRDAFIAAQCPWADYIYIELEVDAMGEGSEAT